MTNLNLLNILANEVIYYLDGGDAISLMLCSSLVYSKIDKEKIKRICTRRKIGGCIQKMANFNKLPFNKRIIRPFEKDLSSYVPKDEYPNDLNEAMAIVCSQKNLQTPWYITFNEVFETSTEPRPHYRKLLNHSSLLNFIKFEQPSTASISFGDIFSIDVESDVDEILFENLPLNFFFYYNIILKTNDIKLGTVGYTLIDGERYIDNMCSVKEYDSVNYFNVSFKLKGNLQAKYVIVFQSRITDIRKLDLKK